MANGPAGRANIDFQKFVNYAVITQIMGKNAFFRGHSADAIAIPVADGCCTLTTPVPNVLGNSY